MHTWNIANKDLKTYLRMLHIMCMHRTNKFGWCIRLYVNISIKEFKIYNCNIGAKT